MYAIPRRTHGRAYGRAAAPHRIPVVVYGTGWCAMTMIVRRMLERHGIPYRYVDLERDPRAARELQWLTGGSLSHPTVAIGGDVLVEPTARELAWYLRQRGLA